MNNPEETGRKEKIQSSTDNWIIRNDMAWKTDAEGVAAMTNAASRLEELSTQIHTETTNLKSAFDSNKDGLGPHAASIEQLIEDVEAIEEEGSRPVKKLVLKLTKAALIRSKIIDNDRYSKVKGKTR